MKNLLIIPCVFLSLGLAAQNPQSPQTLQAEKIMTESSSPLDGQFLDGIVPKTLILENRVLPYEPVREADVPWEKKIWRVIDTREKINLPFVYPEKPFITILNEGAQNGDFAVFKDDKFEMMMTPEDLEGKLYSMDTVAVTDPETYEVSTKIYRNELDPLSIRRFRVKEVWFFDKEASRMKTRILGVAPIKDVIDKNTGELKYEEPLFWVYYPQAREVLSKYRVFNDANDAAPMTWEMVLEDRMFSSYIYKESNVLDRRLQDYLKGVDILLESENIKNSLLNREIDLWEY